MNTLQKMLKPKASAFETDPAADGLAGVLGKAASVVGLSALDVQLEAKSRAAKQCDAAEFMEGLPENGLYFRIECGTDGQIGLLALNADLINVIINVLTGEIEDGGAESRPPTAIDTAMCRPFINEMLVEFSDILRELRGDKKTDTYHTSKVLKEPSPHLFPEILFLQIGLDFEFADSHANGHLLLMIPAINTDFTSTLPRPGESVSAWREAIKNSVEAAPACFEVVLHRTKMPIGTILKLKAGDTIKIPARALENLSIETRIGTEPLQMMRARLGEYQEMRAAKITQIGEETAVDNGPKLLEANSHAEA